MPDRQYDILVAGAGFAGSLMALVLNNLGFKVCLVEKGQHPRFAIGESSTPVADMLLRKLADQYDLPWLHDFSRYGSWQRSHPEIICGIKRGFSFFKHYPGKDFFTDENHKNELLVAASVDDDRSDTNWLRADLDAFLVNKVKETAITYLDLTDVISAKRDNDQWEFGLKRFDEPVTVHASFFIDATGGGGLLDMLFKARSTSEGFLTNSFAIFSHFAGLPRWTEILRASGISTSDFPYDPDNSALHQVLDEGWLWMLRFNDGRTSLGFVLDGNDGLFNGTDNEEIWDSLVKKYPAIASAMKDAVLAALPGKIIRSGRLQRKAERCFGEGWLALPHTAGFVDPLFSTGIAHSLAGIEKIAGIFGRHRYDLGAVYPELGQYEQAVFSELRFIDQLVAGCYKTMRHFGLFNAWCMLYFVSTITYEQALVQNKPTGHFLGADKPEIQAMVQECYATLLKLIVHDKPSDDDTGKFTDMVREKIKPFNTACLLDTSLKNMYHHTAALL